MMKSGKFRKRFSEEESPPLPKKPEPRLPSSSLKPVEEGPSAAERVRRIMEHPSFRRADQDLDLLKRDELRPTRLQLEFLKPEMILSEHRICGTIVVLGGTRIPEPSVARHRVERARKALEQHPQIPELKHRLAVAERILEKSHYYEVARELGHIVGKAGRGPGDCRLAIVTGGGPGLMEAANRGAYDVGAKSVGLNISLPQEQCPNSYITPELCFQFRYFGLRKMHFHLRAKATVAFPGGYGTLDELFETLCLIQTGKTKPVPVILVGEKYWRRVFDVEFLVAEGTIDPEDAELFTFAETAEEIWKTIRDWYQQRGESLFA
jgi:uncharacterized protein (TIGR00730 family)